MKQNAKPQEVLLGRKTNGWYELGSLDGKWRSNDYGFEDIILGLCPADFQLFTNIRMRKGESPKRVIINISEVTTK